MSTNGSGPLKTFLRGGQVTLHTLRMFGQVMRFLSFAMVSLMLVIAWAGVMANTAPEDRHYAMKRYEAWAYRAAGFRESLELNMRTADGTHAPFPIGTILTHPAVAEHEKRFRHQLFVWGRIGGLGGGFGFLILTGLFVGRGSTLTRTQVKRGAAMASAQELRAQISAHNRWTAMKRKELRGRPRYALAGIPYPVGSEVQHTGISGTIGSGKTQAIGALLDQIREAGDRAVVFDLTGGFIAPFYRDDRDTILNPLDRRAPAWSVFDEAKTKAGFDAIAAAMIPRAQKADPVWADSARMVFSTAGQLLLGDGRARNEDLVDLLLNAELTTLAPFFAGTPAASIISADTPRMTNSVRMMLSTYLDGFRLLPSQGDRFSITDWIENGDERSARNAGSTLFLSSRADMHETLRPLLTVWMDTAVRALMSRPRDPNRRIWFIMDEVAALQELPSIMDGLARGRQFGAAFVLGIQAQSQLRDIYGPDGAQTLSSVCRTKLILAASDADTAKWYADFLGRQETSRSNENVSFGANTIRDGVMVARQERIEHLVIPEEIMNLRSLEGYLKMPEGFPLAKVKVPLVLREDREPAFLPREDRGLLITRARAPHTVKAMQAAARRPGSEDGQRDMFSEAERDGIDEMIDPETGEVSATTRVKGMEQEGAESADPSSPPDRPRPRDTGQDFPDWGLEP